MALVPIVTGKHQPVLTKKATKVVKFDKSLKKLIADLEDTVQFDKGLGVGLAAPQIGIDKRVFVAAIDDVVTVMVNPEIIWRSDDIISKEEGCLSLPGIEVVVGRPREIIVTYLDKKGRERERKLQNFNARVVQHEYDHLDGILITDYI